MLRPLRALPLVLLTLPAAAGDDTCGTAINVTAVPGAVFILPNRQLGPGDLVDYYRTPVGPGVQLECSAWFEAADGNIDLRLWNADCTVLLDESSSLDDDEMVSWTNLGTSSASVVCEVFLLPPASGIVIYDYAVAPHLVDCAADDNWEQNDTCATARVIPFDYFIHEPWRIVRQGDDDYYELTVPPNTLSTVSIGYTFADGNINARLLDDDCATVLATSSTDDDEVFLLDNPGPASRTYVVHVYLSSQAPVPCNDYVFTLLASTGYNYCTSSPNSSGAPAVMQGYGGASVSANHLTLRALPIPANSIGVFFYGPTEASFPFGNGTRCVGPNVVRSPIAHEYNGALEWAVDFDELAGTSLPVFPGATYHFQAWFRDPAAGGAAFDLSDGYRITFLP